MTNNEGKYLCNNPSNICSFHSFLHFHGKSNPQRIFAYRVLPTMQASEFPKNQTSNYNKNTHQLKSLIYKKNFGREERERGERERRKTNHDHIQYYSKDTELAL